MPPPDRMLTTLRRAIDYVAATPGRRGHLVHLQNCAEVMVVGDLHGHVPNFRAALEKAALAANPGRHLVVQELVHGPFKYPDGTDKSHQLVDLFAALKCQFPDRVHYLPGNHEMAQWKGRKVGKGTDDLNAQFSLGVRAAYGSAAVDIYRAYTDLFTALPLALRTPNRVFITHTLVPGKQLDNFDPASLEAEEYAPQEYEPGGLVYGILWGRDVSAATAVAFLDKVDADLSVTGHIANDAGYHVPNDRQLIVECSESPGGYVLFPTDRPLTHAELVACVGTI
ncbi:metallophosphoesterase [Fimbriiglobus ruber]|uniref:Calcineurin-like phosphoesterase domain-containing protein n=1 Tax=Fimbriiglobus ruber TaxID=1908690 RepID=A0A225DSU9_9BACT|nr:metallophosphoesterase [Fimbriiglobus ruber]OWK44512.1 hypothetical protein FRUB_02444 [Fimbriiglobus ruber]